MANKIKPLFDRVLLEQIKEVESKNGVYIPQSTSDKSLVMSIVSIGDRCAEKFVVGEKVIVHKFAGVEINHDGRKFLIIKAIDVLAKLGEVI